MKKKTRTMMHKVFYLRDDIDYMCQEKKEEEDT